MAKGKSVKKIVKKENLKRAFSQWAYQIFVMGAIGAVFIVVPLRARLHVPDEEKITMEMLATTGETHRVPIEKTESFAMWFKSELLKQGTKGDAASAKAPGGE